MFAENNAFNYFYWEKIKNFGLNIHHNGANSYLLINGSEFYNFKAKDSEIVPNIVCLGKVSKYFAADNMKKKGFMILVLIIRQFLLLLYHTFIKN